MPIGTPENIDCGILSFKNAPSDATHYCEVDGELGFYKQDAGYIQKFINGVWYPLNFTKMPSIEECIKVTPNSRILASRSLKEEQDSVWEYLKGNEDHFRLAHEDAELVEDYCNTTKFYYKTGKDRLLMWLSIWCRSPKIFSFGEDGSYRANFPVLAVRRKVKKIKPIDKVIKVDCVIKSTPTEDKTVQEFQNGQEVMWHRGKAFYVGESKEKGKSVIEIITNQGIHSSTYTQTTVETSSLSPVEKDQKIHCC